MKGFLEFAGAVPPEEIDKKEPEPEPLPPPETKHPSMSAPGCRKIPGEMLDYLECIVLPEDGLLFLCMNLEEVDWEALEDNFFHAAIVQGAPTPEQSAEIYRILRPGGHIMLIAPDDNPIGDIGAVNIEDVGFEIRDAIAWVRKPGRNHYVPKVKSRKQRSAGFVDSRNPHPTVKPVRVMKALLEDIPKEDVVGDAFLGSGSTGLACVETGHDFIGTELDDEYHPVAIERIHGHTGKGRNAWTRKPEIITPGFVRDPARFRRDDEMEAEGLMAIMEDIFDEDSEEDED